MQSKTLTSLVVVFLVGMTLCPAAATARYHYSSPRPYYDCCHHTYSRGGHYLGDIGRSHRFGHYLNPRTGNHYGRHKT
jgi:hypothetical protein